MKKLTLIIAVLFLTACGSDSNLDSEVETPSNETPAELQTLPNSDFSVTLSDRQNIYNCSYKSVFAKIMVMDSEISTLLSEQTTVHTRHYWNYRYTLTVDSVEATSIRVTTIREEDNGSGTYLVTDTETATLLFNVEDSVVEVELDHCADSEPLMSFTYDLDEL